MEREVTIPEWGSVAAAKSGDGRALAGLYLDSPEVSAAVARANLRNRLRIRDGRDGLVVQARQHVGVVQLGPLRIRIRPKMQHSHLWSAVAYALGLDGIVVGDRAQFSVTDSFADLLGRMLLLEAANLWRNGLRHDYVTREAWLGSPPGASAASRTRPPRTTRPSGAAVSLQRVHRRHTREPSGTGGT